MKLAAAVLCTEQPQEDGDGRADLRGIYYRLITKSLPAPLVGWLYLSFRIGAEDFGTDRITFDLQLRHEAGEKAALAPWTAPVDRGRKEQLGTVFTVLDISRIEVTQPGYHEFVIWANMHEVAAVPFVVASK